MARWVTPSEFRQMFDTHTTRVIGLSCGEETITICWVIHFDRIPQRDERIDGRTDRIAISISRVSVLTRDKNRHSLPKGHVNRDAFRHIIMPYSMSSSVWVPILRKCLAEDLRCDSSEFCSVGYCTAYQQCTDPLHG